MKKYIAKIVAGVAVVALLLTGYSLVTQQPQALGSSSQIGTPIALFSTSLAAPITQSSSSMTLVSATTLDGTTLASSTYAFILDEGQSNQEFVVADCTGTACTNMQRGISAITGTTTISSLTQAHRRGATVSITDAPILINLTNTVNGVSIFPNVISYGPTTSTSTISSAGIPDVAWVNNVANIASTSAYNSTNSNILAGSNTYTGTNIFSNLTTHNGGLISNASSTFVSAVNVPYSVASSSAASVGYANALSFAGVANANTSTKGISQLSTNAQAAASTANGSTGAALVLPASLATSTSQVAQNSVVVTGTDGKIDPSFLNGGSESYTFNGVLTLNNTSNIFGNFGDGSDSNVTINAGATTTLSRNMYYNNLTVNGALVTNGYIVYVKGTVSGSGSITWGIPNNGGNASGAVGGSGGSATAGGPFANQAGGAGASGSSANGACSSGFTATNVAAQSSSLGGNGGQGGVPTCGTVRATAGATSTTMRPGTIAYLTLAGTDLSSTGSSVFLKGGGAGSGGGAPTNSNDNNGVPTGGGGGGGASCGGVLLIANTMSGTFTQYCNGGKGGIGATSDSTTGADGGGGGGGWIMDIFATSTWSGTHSVLGGATTGSVGSPIAGSDGQFFSIPIINLLR